MIFSGNRHPSPDQVRRQAFSGSCSKGRRPRRCCRRWVIHPDIASDVLAAGKSIALAFSDVVLPGHTDGLALARNIAARYQNIPVALTTGYTKLFDATLEFPVLRKPYQISALGRVIQQSLDPPDPVCSVRAG